jgi:hypothetical protein
MGQTGSDDEERIAPGSDAVGDEATDDDATDDEDADLSDVQSAEPAATEVEHETFPPHPPSEPG